MADNPGKWLTVSGNDNGNEVTLADCDQYDPYQLFDQKNLLVNLFYIRFYNLYSGGIVNLCISFYSELQYKSWSIETIAYGKMFVRIVK